MVNGWIITEGMAGTENQCLGVAEALKIEPLVKRVTLRQPWKSLSPLIANEQAWSFVPKLTGPWPDLLLTSGRKAVAAARFVRKNNPSCFLVHIQDPRVDPALFDLVAVPYHDRLRGDNVLVTDGAPNRITPALLAAAPHPAPSTKPCVGVLIGGDSKTHRLSEAVMARLTAQLVTLAKTHKLLVTVSRRTAPRQARMLAGALADTDAYLWDGTGENPYFGILAQADWLLVTNDSASMLSDAASTGKPVYMLALDGASPKFDKLYARLRETGAARDFAGVLERWDYPPFTDARKIADAVRKASGLFDD